MLENYPLIASIKSIEDYKRMDEARLNELAAEIRAFLVKSVSDCGGHLASNLGVVELTMAMHRVFSSPKDKLIFDVGHQSYVHKILTGRAASFDRLRRADGISGFPKPSESEHDAFATGHASTAISAAVGLQRAIVARGEDSYVAALVGDGALTGGMAFEALNDAGLSKLPLIVILNDNNMSISRNVGALNKHLNTMRSSVGYNKFKGSVASMLGKIPKVGTRLSNRVLRLKNRLKYLLIPNVLFEEMGYTYLGPVDGYDIKLMEKTLLQAKQLKRPVVVHVLTVKGKGYEFAERDPERFHGIGKFNVQNGLSFTPPRETNSEVFSKELVRLAQDDSSIMAITAAMPSGTALEMFQNRFPERFFDVGIAEQHAVTMAAGLAAGGMRPVAAIYSTFLQRAYDQLLHDVCLQKLPVIFGVDRAGLVGDDGETHQGVYDIAYLLTLPGMSIMSPSTKRELRQMLNIAMKLSTPCAIRYGRGALEEGDEADGNVEYGKWCELKPIKSVTIVATGRMMEQAARAAAGYDVGLVNARFIRPWDENMVTELKKNANTVISVEDGIRDGGFGSMIADILSGSTRVVRVGVRQAPVSQGTRAEQDAMCQMDEKSIRKLIEELL